MAPSRIWNGVKPGIRDGDSSSGVGVGDGSGEDVGEGSGEGPPEGAFYTVTGMNRETRKRNSLPFTDREAQGAGQDVRREMVRS